MSKKRKAPPRVVKTDPYSIDQLLTSSKSRLIDADLHGKLVAFFRDPSNWAEVPNDDKDFIRTLLPPHVELNDDGSIPATFWKYNPEFRLDCRNLQEDLRSGRMDPEWQQQAAQAMEERVAGHFDNFKEKEFEEYWGQKQKIDWNVLAGHASKVRLDELLREELFRVGDVWCFDHTFGRGEEAIRVEKECKIVKIDGKSITLAIPPQQLKFARRLEQSIPSTNDQAMAAPLPATAPNLQMTNGEDTNMREAPTRNAKEVTATSASTSEGNGATGNGEDLSEGVEKAAPMTGNEAKTKHSSLFIPGACEAAKNSEDVGKGVDVPTGEENYVVETVKDSNDDIKNAETEDQASTPIQTPQLRKGSSTVSSELSNLPPSSQDVQTPTDPTTNDHSDPLSAATEYDIILYTTTGLWELEKEILKIDGRVKPGSRTASTWRVIRCRRDEQDMGSLFEMRDEYYAYNVAKGNYRVGRLSR